ncbi:MAG: hypothetical protein JSR17_11145 [Proteobacteria bacterium]|nr:hypothetical protein [Pseudomonadota bacterium]
MKYQNLTLNIEHSPILQQWFSAVIELIPQIPALKNLIESATVNGPITVDFVSRQETATGGSYEEQGVISGNKKTLTRRIKIAAENASFKDMFETLIFELCNAKNPYFQLFSKEHISPEKYEDSEAYALATEFAEYTCTHVPAKQITKEIFSDKKNVAAFSAKGLPLSPNDLYNFTNDFFTSFNDWWQHTNKLVKGRDYSHADVYRRQFDRKRWYTLQDPVLPPPMITPLKGQEAVVVQKAQPVNPAPAKVAPAKAIPATAAPVTSAPVKAAPKDFMQELNERLKKPVAQQQKQPELPKPAAVKLTENRQPTALKRPLPPPPKGRPLPPPPVKKEVPVQPQAVQPVKKEVPAQPQAVQSVKKEVPARPQVVQQNPQGDAGKTPKVMLPLDKMGIPVNHPCAAQMQKALDSFVEDVLKRHPNCQHVNITFQWQTQQAQQTQPQGVKVCHHVGHKQKMRFQ